MTMRMVFPIQLRVGDRFTDEAGDWEVVGHPEALRQGRTIQVRIVRPGPASRRAFATAVELARWRRAELLVAHVLPPLPLLPDVYVAAHHAAPASSQISFRSLGSWARTSSASPGDNCRLSAANTARVIQRASRVDGKRASCMTRR